MQLTNYSLQQKPTSCFNNFHILSQTITFVSQTLDMTRVKNLIHLIMTVSSWGVPEIFFYHLCVKHSPDTPFSVNILYSPKPSNIEVQIFSKLSMLNRSTFFQSGTKNRFVKKHVLGRNHFKHTRATNKNKYLRTLPIYYSNLERSSSNPTGEGPASWRYNNNMTDGHKKGINS